MTISTEDRVAGPFAGDGIVTSFPFAFKVFAKTDLEAIKTDALGVDLTTSGGGLVLDSDYSVTLNADQDNNPGGTVTYPLGTSAFPTLPVGEKLTLTTAIPETQLNDLPSGGPWNPRIVEDALDKTVMLTQQLSQQIDRMLRGPISDVAFIGTLPTSTTRALNFLAFDALGDPIASAGSTPGTVPVSTFMATVLDDTTADAALTTLGFTSIALAFRLAATAAAARGLLEVPSDAEIQNGTVIYALDTGTANAVVLNMTPDVTAYAEGQKFRSHKLVTNTGAVTIDIDGLGPVALNAPDGSALLAGQLAAGQPFEVIRHTSSQFRVTSAIPLTGSLPEGYLRDPTVTRDTADSITVGSFQAAPLTASAPVATTSASLTRQLTGLFEVAATGNGISENIGALAVASEFTASDLTFTTGPDNIAAGAGTPFSAAVVGDKIVFSGSGSNDGVFDIVAVNAGGGDIDVGQTIVAEAAGATITAYLIPQDTTLHLHAVKETATGNIRVAADDNVSGSNIGSGATAGWIQVRRLWSFLLDSVSDIHDFNKIGDVCEWVTFTVDLSTSSAAVQNFATRVPSGLSVMGKYMVALASASNDSDASVVLSNGLRASGLVASLANAHMAVDNSGATSQGRGAGYAKVGTDTAQSIYSDQAVTGSVTYTVTTQGYFDKRIA